MPKKTITLTFGDQAENHVGMQKMGTPIKNGFDIDDMQEIKAAFEKAGCDCNLIKLEDLLPESVDKTNLSAHVLIIHDGVSVLLTNKTADDLQNEQENLTPDTKALMYGRVVNKSARHNLCFSNTAQEPDYENGRGRIYSFSDVPLLDKIRKKIKKFVGDKAENIVAEGNYYYDISKCGIGYHGDTERKIVIAIRLGETIPLQYQWFNKNKPIGDPIKLNNIGHGDVYIMSEKATGNDWKKSSLYTLRHAAGCPKFLNLKNK